MKTRSISFLILSLRTVNAAYADAAAVNIAILVGSEVTKTGSFVIDGDLGPYSGSLPPGIVSGTIADTDAFTIQAQSDRTTAYNLAEGKRVRR